MPPASPPAPSTNGQTTQGAARPLAPHHREALWWTLVLVMVVALGVLWFWGIRGSQIPANAPRVSFFGAGAPAWYALQGTTLTPVSGPAGFGKVSVVVIDSGPTLADGDIPVLARAARQAGVMLGLVHTDKTFTPLLADGTEKEGLAVRADGLAAYSISASSGGTGELMLFDFLNPGGPINLGPGRDPRVAGDHSGAFLALAPQGVVRIDPVTHKRDMVVNHSTGDAAGAAISSDGTVVAFPNAGTKQIDFFTIQLTRPAYSNYVGTLSGIPSGGGAFLSDTQFIARSRNSAALYSIPDGTMSRTASLVQKLSL